MFTYSTSSGRVSILYCKAKGSQAFQAVTHKIIIFEVGTPLYLFDSIPQINIVKIADLKAQLFSQCSPLFLINISQFGQFGIEKSLNTHFINV